jgi:hypothetical protein
MRTIALSMPPHAFRRQGCRRPTPRSCAAGANGTNMGQWWGARREAKASNSNSSKVHRREGKRTIFPRKPDLLALPRCTSSESPSSCYDSVTALTLASCIEHVAEANISRPHPPTPSVLCTVLRAHSSKG